MYKEGDCCFFLHHLIPLALFKDNLGPRESNTIVTLVLSFCWLSHVSQGSREQGGTSLDIPLESCKVTVLEKAVKLGSSNPTALFSGAGWQLQLSPLCQALEDKPTFSHLSASARQGRTGAFKAPSSLDTVCNAPNAIPVCDHRQEHGEAGKHLSFWHPAVH